MNLDLSLIVSASIFLVALIGTLLSYRTFKIVKKDSDKNSPRISKIEVDNSELVLRILKPDYNTALDVRDIFIKKSYSFSTYTSLNFKKVSWDNFSPQTEVEAYYRCQLPENFKLGKTYLVQVYTNAGICERKFHVT